jgi:hypothetical protein
MRVNGYQLRESIKKYQLELVNLERKFNKSMFRFADQEKKEHPTRLADGLLDLEQKIVRLQTAQNEYNLAVIVNFNNKSMTLAEAVKLQGVLGRHVSRWQMFQGRDLDGEEELVRVQRKDVTEERAKPVMNNDEVLEKVLAAEKMASTLKGVIARANSEEAPVKALADLTEL